MSAVKIAKALGGKRSGACWMARCPAHDDTTPSLSIVETREGKVLVRCHARCEQRAVIAALRERGLWGGSSAPTRSTRDPASAVYGDIADKRMKRRVGRALQIWCETRPAAGTLSEVYIRARGINFPLPPGLRFHHALKHPLGGSWPALVGLVTLGAQNTPVAVHRTFLALDGQGKAPLAVNKMMLGPCRGGAVRLAPSPSEGPLLICEGIETCLSVMQATGHAAWAALSTSGLRSLELPRDVRDVIVLADGDKPGEAAAQACAQRWKREGRRVRIARPPQGMDFNDLLIARNPIFRKGVT